MTYHYCNGSKAVENLITGAGKEHNFIEGFAFSPTDFIVMLSDFSEDQHPPTKNINHINRYYKPFFHNQVKKVMKRLKRGDGKGTIEEYIPTLDYYHRHTRGVFWMSDQAFGSICRRDSLFWLFGWTLPFPVHAQALAPWTVNYVKQKTVLQDYLVPVQNFQRFFEQGCEDFKVLLVTDRTKV